MEVLAGAVDESHFVALRRLPARETVLPTAVSDCVDAGEDGEDRSQADRQSIASVAIRAGVAILHREFDFDVLARHTELQADDSP